MSRPLILPITLLPLVAQEIKLAPTPPTGWNSWDSYGLSITETEFRANARVLAERLKQYGWNYAVVMKGGTCRIPKQGLVNSSLLSMRMDVTCPTRTAFIRLRTVPVSSR